EQRRLIHDWLAKLRDNVDHMPAHVVEKVKNDYRTRLDGVMAELASHRDALREALEEAQSKQGDLDEVQQKKKDELTELKLRKQVGEVEDGRYKDQSSSLQGSIEQIKKDLSSTLRDIEKFEEILEVISAGDKDKDEDDDEEEEADDDERED